MQSSGFQMNQFGRRHHQQRQETDEFEEKVVQVNRVSKKTKGGNRMSFSALLVVGDRKGRVGVGLGKAPDTLSAIKKGARRARKHLIKVPMRNNTIPFPIVIKRGAAQVLLKPAPPGTGVIAGGAVRAVVEAAGIRDIVAKILGSSNKASNVYATFAGLQRIKRIATKIFGPDGSARRESGSGEVQKPSQPVRPEKQEPPGKAVSGKKLGKKAKK